MKEIHQHRQRKNVFVCVEIVHVTFVWRGKIAQTYDESELSVSVECPLKELNCSDRREMCA